MYPHICTDWDGALNGGCYIFHRERSRLVFFRPEASEIVLMSAYQMHGSPVAGPEDVGWRNFMRLDT